MTGFGSLETFRTGLRNQARVLSAIALRDMLTRYGRRNFGFAWLILEPLVFSFPVLAVWKAVRPATEHGIPMMDFMWSGYMPLLLFRHVTGNALHSIRGSAALLYHRSITPTDIVFARQGLEALANLGSMAISYLVYLVIGFLSLPYDFITLLAGVLYNAWWALAVSFVLAALSERSEYVAHLWSPISYLYIFYSGFMIMAEWLPDDLRRIALAVDPPLHCYEMIRFGLFGDVVPTHYDIPYLTFILATMTLIGLLLLRRAREYIELE